MGVGVRGGRFGPGLPPTYGPEVAGISISLSISSTMPRQKGLRYHGQKRSEMPRTEKVGDAMDRKGRLSVRPWRNTGRGGQHGSQTPCCPAVLFRIISTRCNSDGLHAQIR